jgi:hypothetical protein
METMAAATGRIARGKQSTGQTVLQRAARNIRINPMYVDTAWRAAVPRPAYHSITLESCRVTHRMTMTEATDPRRAQVDALIDAAFRGRHEDSRRSLATARQALALAEQADYGRGRAWALLRVALCEWIVADADRQY